MAKIRIAIAGVGNCASSLIQGVHFYAQATGEDAVLGLAHPLVGRYRAGDIEVVAAFDIDMRKVGQPFNDAIFAAPNNTKIFFRPPAGEGPIVKMAPVEDGVAPHMADYPEHLRFVDAVRRDGHRVTRVRTVGPAAPTDHGRFTVSPREIDLILNASQSEDPS